MLSLTSLEGKSHFRISSSLRCNKADKHRYANVTLRFLTDELGFDNDDICREFLVSHGAQTIIEQTDRVKIREAASLFEGLRAAAFRKVDIKGQI
jgi:hypothetical protein